MKEAFLRHIFCDLKEAKCLEVFFFILRAMELGLFSILVFLSILYFV